MIYDKNGIIRKLDTKSIFSFLKTNKKPLIIYGMGELGQLTLNALIKKNIRVDGIGDGSVNKQHTFIGDLEILSIDELKNQFPDAVIWLTIADFKIRKSVVKLLNDNGFTKDILTFDIKAPTSPDYYQDYDVDLPVIIVGTNDSAVEVYKYLQSKNIEVLFFLDCENEEIKELCNIPVYNINVALDIPEDVNILVFDDTKWNDIVFYLHEQGVYENIYRAIINTVGKFNLRKYFFEVAVIRNALLKQACFLNYDYYALKDEASRSVFKEICNEFFAYAFQNKLISHYNTSEEYIFETILLDESEKVEICDEYKFEDITKNISAFIIFLKTLTSLCTNETYAPKIECKGAQYYITRT